MEFKGTANSSSSSKHNPFQKPLLILYVQSRTYLFQKAILPVKMLSSVLFLTVVMAGQLTLHISPEMQSFARGTPSSFSLRVPTNWPANHLPPHTALPSVLLASPVSPKEPGGLGQYCTVDSDCKTTNPGAKLCCKDQYNFNTKEGLCMLVGAGLLCRGG